MLVDMASNSYVTPIYLSKTLFENKRYGGERLLWNRSIPEKSSFVIQGLRAGSVYPGPDWFFSFADRLIQFRIKSTSLTSAPLLPIAQTDTEGGWTYAYSVRKLGRAYTSWFTG